MRIESMSPAVSTSFLLLVSVRMSVHVGFLLYALREITILVPTCALQGIMAMRAYELLGRPKLFGSTLALLFVVIQCINIALNLMMFKDVLDTSGESFSFSDMRRINIAGYNVCEVGAPPSLAWVTPTTNALLMAYEILLCGAVLRYALKEVRGFSWKSPTKPFSTLVAVIVRDNLIYFIVVTISMLVAVTNATGITSGTNLFDNGSYFLLSLQVSMIGPWITINLRRNYESTAMSETMYDSHELEPVVFVAVDRLEDAYRFLLSVIRGAKKNYRYRTIPTSTSGTALTAAFVIMLWSIKRLKLRPYCVLRDRSERMRSRTL
ncbi:hypothetical protein CONPUDRAFT_145137 [Coniophora puteana RWD-64-598 SS2]|uniref:Transmembrane protein n=1 Tax=Coniophora puteana (strain RWD-64-598) TaxID=741705 RepID=A0A5M3MI37_CONPW|nr:uncharacterized protein CONPUDRAFT_145137 [Coniophora puteana RWD-64-598 SS2]EIW78872.1 hypothetical protein CONPUDRAFT_145137 [Coniophora puteana RWD-64-598 SS2]